MAITTRRFPCITKDDAQVFCEFLQSIRSGVCPMYRYRVVAPWLVNDAVAQHTCVYTLQDAQVLAAKARGCEVSDVIIEEGERI